MRIAAGPELGQVEMRHDPVLGGSLRPEGGERRFHALGLHAGAREIALFEREQHLPPLPQHRELGRTGAERGK
jgi:hypothetical protein